MKRSSMGTLPWTRLAPALALPFATLSAQVSPGDIDEQRRRAQEEDEARRKQREAPHVTLQAPKMEEVDSLALPEEVPGYRIHRFALVAPAGLPDHVRAHGASRREGDSFRFALAYLERYRGRTLGKAGLDLIVRRLTRRILARGYTTTRLEVPPQDLATGTLTLHLIPGVIGALRFADPATRGSWRAAFPARPGDLLNLRDLEQGLEHLKALPSQDVSIAILPGARTGESDIVITLVRGRPWRVTTTLDDSGQKATGRWQGGLNAAWDNPLGLADRLGLAWNHDVTRGLQGAGTHSFSASYTVPRGYWTFGLSCGQQAYRQRLAASREGIFASGSSRNLDARAGLVIHRGQNVKSMLQFRAGHRSSRSFLADTEITVQRRRTSFAEVALIHTRYFGRAQVDLTLAHRQGVPWFGAQEELEQGPGGGPTFRYRLQTLDATLVLPWTTGGRNFTYTATLHAQDTAMALYATEHLTLGNRWTVRGFDGERGLAAGAGAFLRNDLACPLGRGLGIYLGLDAGRLWGPGALDLPGRTIMGAVLGVKATAGSRFTCNGFLGAPLRRPPGFPGSGPVLGINASFHF